MPNSPMKLTLLFVDVIWHFLELSPLNLESAKWIISQFLLKLPTTTVWRSLWLKDSVNNPHRSTRCVHLQIQPMGVPRGFIESSISVSVTRVSILLDILLLCGFTVRDVRTQDENKKMLETFKRNSEERYRDISRTPVQNGCVEVIRRSLRLPLTNDDLKTLRVPNKLIVMINREDIVELVMDKLQQ